jgi:hypothetical protein
LQQCFDLLHESLCSKPGSRLGLQELIATAREVEIAGGAAFQKMREDGFALHADPHAIPSCPIMSNAIFEQLNDWHHPLRLEIALVTMLDALPKLEDPLFWKVDVEAWGPILVGHGLEDSATKLATAINERRTANHAIESATASHQQNSVHRSQASDRTPRPVVPRVGRFEGSMEALDRHSLGMRTPRESDFEYYDNTSDYSFATMTEDSAPARGATFSQLFNPSQRKILKMTAAHSRRRFTDRLNGGFPVATPGTVASNRSSATPTPCLKGTRAPRRSSKRRGGLAVQKTIYEQEPSDEEESDEEDRGNEAVSVDEETSGDEELEGDEGRTGGQQLSEESIDGDEEMSEYAD